MSAGRFSTGLFFAVIVVAVGLGGCTTQNESGGAVDTLQLAQSSSTPGAAGALRMVNDLPVPASVQSGESQPVSANDVLEVDVFQVDNLDRTVQVDAAGNISLPLIGQVPAAGKTVRQLEQDVETAYGKNYLQSPDVTIFMKESVGQRVTVDGEVNKAGIFPVNSSSTLLDAIALAGGFSQIGDPSKVFVYRTYGSQQLVANYDVKQVREGRKTNPRIYGGDVIVVFQSGRKVAMNNLKDVLGIARSAVGIAVLP